MADKLLLIHHNHKLAHAARGSSKQLLVRTKNRLEGQTKVCPSFYCAKFYEGIVDSTSTCAIVMCISNVVT